MTTTKSIAVADAANELGLSEEELRELLKDYYKTHETIQRISTKNFAEIAQKLEESQDLSEPTELEVEENNNEVQFELVTPDSLPLEPQEVNGNGHNPQIITREQDLEVATEEENFHPTENTEEIDNNDFFLSQDTEGVNTEEAKETEEEKDQFNQSHDQVQLQREEDMKVAWRTTAEQATGFAKKLEAGYWLIVAAARSSKEVQDCPEVKEARDFALGIGDGGLQNSAHVKSVEKYLEDKGFFARLQQKSDEQKQLTD